MERARIAEMGVTGGGRSGARRSGIGIGAAVLLLLAAVGASAASFGGVPAPSASLQGSSPERDDAGTTLVPGGIDFIASILGMTAPEGDRQRERFMTRVLVFLEDPGMRLAATRLARMLEEHTEMRRLLHRLARSGRTEPSLADPGSRSYEAAEEILDFFGLEPEEERGRRVFDVDDGDDETRRRELLRHLGVPWKDHREAWLAGRPIRIPVEDDEIPLLFGARAWEDRVFERRFRGSGLFEAIVTDSRARKVYLGYARMDRASRDATFRRVGLRPIYRDERLARHFPRFAEYVRFEADGPVFPGGDRGVWWELLDGWDDAGELLEELAHRDDGRAAHLWRALSLLPERRARYLLTGGRSSREGRREWAEQIYDRIRVRSYPLDPTRWSGDVAELFLSLRMAPDEERLEWPGGARSWRAALAGNGPIDEKKDLEAVLEQGSSGPPSGPEADLGLLRRLIEESWPAPHRLESGPTAIETYLAVSTALRHQPEATRRRVIPLLARNHERLRTAFGLLVDAGPLTAEQIEALAFHMIRVDGFWDETARLESLRQLQATLLLLRRLIRNGALADESRDRVLAELVALDQQILEGAFGVKRLGYGTGMPEWYWRVLLPALEDREGPDGGAVGASGRGGGPPVGSGTRGGSGIDPAIASGVDRLLEGLVGEVRSRPFEVAGIRYVYAPGERFRRRLLLHLERQEIPSLAVLLSLDRLLAEIESRSVPGRGIDERAAAERIRTLTDGLESSTLEAARHGRLDGELPVPVDRDELLSRARELARDLQRGPVGGDDAARARHALASWLGDALVGLAYAAEMGDPDVLFYRGRVVAWRHRLAPDDETEIAGGGPWAPTAEWDHPESGRVLANSLLGIPVRVGRWNLEAAAFEGSGGELVDSLEETWGATLGELHPGSLDDGTQELVHRAHERATAWIRSAVHDRDPRAPAPDAVAGDSGPSGRSDVELSRRLRRLMRPRPWQGFVDAVEDGDEYEALSRVTPGNRFLLVRMAGGMPPEGSRTLEQAIGMSWSRRGDHLGLALPPLVPYGEAGDRWEDPVLFSRIVDVRVALAVALQEAGLPAALQAPVLPLAMAEVMGTVEPDTMAVWEELVEEVPGSIDRAAVRRWVEELAFDDVLTPAPATAEAAGSPPR